MNTPKPLAVEHLLTDDQRRTITVDQHAAFREALAPRPPADPIDELVAELRETQPEGDEL